MSTYNKHPDETTPKYYYRCEHKTVSIVAINAKSQAEADHLMNLCDELPASVFKLVDTFTHLPKITRTKPPKPDDLEKIYE